MRLGAVAVAGCAGLAALAGACVAPLEPAELGTARLIGVVAGAAPLAGLPPLTDRDGNVYVALAEPDGVRSAAFIGHAAGGWSTGCVLDTGGPPRAWLGHDDDDAWYWAGDALVALDGDTGGCRRVLDRDPVTGTDLEFIAVVPSVRETDSRTTAVAVVRGGGGGAPYVAVVDLEERVLADVRPLADVPADAIGLGAGGDGDRGVVVLAHGGELDVRWLDVDGGERRRARVAAPDGVVIDGGVAVAGGLAAAVLVDPSGARTVLRAAGDAAVITPVAGIAPAGAHAHAGGLWVAGDAGGQAALAAIDADGIAPPVSWATSARVDGALAGGIVVVDDRGADLRRERWDRAATALGAHPFASAHDPRDHAVDVAGWLAAGPTRTTGGQVFTTIAFVPIGISYP